MIHVSAGLKARRKKAQDNGDIAEEAKLCNSIGEMYSQDGMDYYGCRSSVHKNYYYGCRSSVQELLLWL